MELTSKSQRRYMSSQEGKKKAEKSFFLVFFLVFFFPEKLYFSDGGNWLNSGGEGLK